MCGKLPHVETLSNPDNYSLPFVTQVDHCVTHNTWCSRYDDSDKLIAIDDVDVIAVETGPTGSVPIVWAARPAT